MALSLTRIKYSRSTTEVKYLGQIFCAEGMKPDPEYIQAIVALKEPNNKKDLLSFLGMVNYLLKYLPNLADKIAPLRELLRCSVEWNWTEIHRKIFNDLKCFITKIPTLQIFDPEVAITIQTDASQYGIGSVMLQNEKPVAFAS